MPLRGWTVSDQSFYVYRFDIPLSPVNPSGGGTAGTGPCPNVVRIDSDSAAGLQSLQQITAPPAPANLGSGRDIEGLTNAPLAAGNVNVRGMSEDDENGGAGELWSNLNTNGAFPTNVGPVERQGDDAGLAYRQNNTSGQNHFNIQTLSNFAPSTTNSWLYRFPFSTPGNTSQIGTDTQRADGFGIRGDGLGFATEAKDNNSLFRVNLSGGNNFLSRVGPLHLNGAPIDLNQDTGFDFAPSNAGNEAGRAFMLAEDGQLFRVNIPTTLPPLGTDGNTSVSIVRWCQTGLKANDEAFFQPSTTNDPEFEGLAVTFVPATTASVPAQNSMLATFADITMGAPVMIGLVLGSVGVASKKLFRK